METATTELAKTIPGTMGARLIVYADRFDALGLVPVVGWNCNPRDVDILFIGRRDLPDSMRVTPHGEQRLFERERERLRLRTHERRLEDLQARAAAPWRRIA